MPLFQLERITVKYKWDISLILLEITGPSVSIFKEIVLKNIILFTIKNTLFHYKNNERFTETVRTLSTIFHRRSVPNESSGFCSGNSSEPVR